MVSRLLEIASSVLCILMDSSSHNKHVSLLHNAKASSQMGGSKEQGIHKGITVPTAQHPDQALAFMVWNL